MHRVYELHSTVVSVFDKLSQQNPAESSLFRQNLYPTPLVVIQVLMSVTTAAKEIENKKNNIYVRIKIQ